MSRLFLAFFCLCAFVVVASPARVITYYDGSNASYFETEGHWDPLNAEEHFSYRALTYDKDAHAIDYKFIPKKDNVEYTLLYWRPNGVTAAQKFVVRMRNLGDSALKIEGSWVTSREGVPGTSSWYEWRYPGLQEIPADGQWHDLVFDMNPATVVSDGRDLSPVPLYKPQGRFDIVAKAIPAGVEMHYQIAELRGEDDISAKASVQWDFDFPAKMTAGAEVHLPGFTADFQGRVPYDPEARLVFRPTFKDASWPELPIALEGVEKVGSTWRLAPQTFVLTPFLLDGEYEVTLECGEAILENAVFKVQVHGRKDVAFRNMSVKPFGGRPTMFRDDEPLPGVMRATYTTEGPKGIKAFTDCGVNIFGFCSTPTEGGYNLEMLTQYGPDQYCYQQFDRRMRNTLAVNPEAMLIVRLYLHAPRWWSQDHPDDMCWVVKENDPTAEKKIFVWNQGRAVPSWASRAWRDFTKEGLRKMMDFLAQTPYADHIAGFVLASGTTEEWMEWGFTSGVVADYSPASEIAFKAFLKEKYSTDAALQKAWHDDKVTLATATQPSAPERHAADFPGFLTPEAPNGQRIADYNRYHAENVSGCIDEFCKTIKDATQNRLLAGAFYGYFVELSGDKRVLCSGHLGVGKLLESTYLDYLCSPTGYAYRQTGGDGMSYCMGAGDSLQIHNKFWFVENDIRTSATADPHHGRPDDTWGDYLQQTKESIHNLLTGMAQWWFDVGYVRQVDKLFYDGVRDCVRVMNDTTLKYTREPVAQVALIIDEESIDWTTLSSTQVGSAVRGLQRTIAQLGAPYEVYLQQDLANLPERIRLIFMPMSLCWKPEHKAFLDKFKSEGRVVFFVGTPGVIPPAGMTREESAQALTGLPLRFVSASGTSLCVLDNPDGEWLSMDLLGQSLPGVAWKESKDSTIQAVLEQGDGVRVFGHYSDRSTGKLTDLGAMGVRELGDACVVFSGIMNIPRELLENAYARAGVHRYVDAADQVWATKNVFAVCVKEGGVKMLRTPRACKSLTDLISGESFSVDAEGICCVEFLPRQTKVFLME